MTLPRLLVLTDRRQCAAPLQDVLAAAIDCGATAVVLREKDLSRPDRARLAARLTPLLGSVDGTLIIAGTDGLGIRPDAVHLSAADGCPAARPTVVGRSCHTPAEVSRAAAEGCDYVTVSPVFTSASKPGYGPALGIDALRGVCRAAPMPTYALGGVDPESAAACREAGAYGVAAMGPIMRDPTIVAAYLAALPEEDA